MRELENIRYDIVIMLYQTDLLNKKFEDEESEKYNTYIEVIKNIDEIDDIIEDNLYNYSLNRIAYIDRAIIRLATYELNYTETPVAIVIDEAIKMTKKYSDLDDGKQHRFSNKLLDNIAKDIRG